MKGKDPRVELYKYLLHYRATPYTTTEKSPAEMLFSRGLQTKLTYIFRSNETDEQNKTRDLHDQKKLKQKYCFDKWRMAKPKEINVGDKVLIDNQVHAIKKDGTVKVRDKNQLKKVKERPWHLCPTWKKSSSRSSANYFNFDGNIVTETGPDSSEETYVPLTE